MGLVFSWGNDINHKGLLGLGENIYQVNKPVLNKYLSKMRIFDLSMSDNHCAAVDFSNRLYTWGIGEHGELGYYDEKEKNSMEPVKVGMSVPLLVSKIKCGKFYTAGITSKGIPFLFGNKNVNKSNGDIIFFEFNKSDNVNINNNESIIDYEIGKDVYCGEKFLIILLDKGQILIYSINDGLYKIIFNNENNNNYFI